jgi:hypothetical protein
VLIPNPRGAQSLTVTISQSGPVLSGLGVTIVPGPTDGSTPIGATLAGRIEGGAVTFVLTTVEPGWGGTFEGRRRSADRIEGTFTSSGAQQFPATLTRTP